jgi:MFS family permease
MFGGRDFVYMSVVPRHSPVTPIADGSQTAVRAVAEALLPIAAALVAALFSVLLVRSFLRRRTGEKLLWAAGFAAFAVAAASEALAQGSGWTAALFRTYYLAGGILTVALLGAGSAWLHLPRRGRDVMLGGLVAASLAAAVTVVLAPVDGATVATTAIGRPPANGALGGHAFLWAIALNTFGTIFLLGGSVYSIARRTRVRANTWIATGALVLALATSMSRAGVYSLVYAGELVGLLLMFYGFNGGGARRRVVRVRPETTARPAVRPPQPAGLGPS